MSAQGGARSSFSFEPTPAVAASRARVRYVDCSVCQTQEADYLFHKVGVRFVRCRRCGMVYTNPVGEAGVSYFDMSATGAFANPEDRRLCLEDFGALLARTDEQFRRVEGRPIGKAVLVGRYLREFANVGADKGINLNIVETTDAEFAALASDSDTAWLDKRIGDADVLILNELLEACVDPAAVVKHLQDATRNGAWIVVSYANSESLPAKFLRRYWPPFFDYKRSFFNTNNLTALFARFGYAIQLQIPYPLTQTAAYIARRFSPGSLAARTVEHLPIAQVPVPLRTGMRIAMFRKIARAPREKLSIVFPCFNEARYVADVIDTILAKPLKIDKELIIVESNSTDGTRDIVSKYADHPDVKLIFEERPRGKGHAVRTGLKAVTGTIILIQDADFEYDVDDYDALLEPILQRRTSFVLGSRSLGIGDWKVRKFGTGRVRGFLLNAAHVGFAKTFNVLYQQRVTDVNTMFKVFRRECLDGLDLESNGFALDIELACKLVRNGNAALEVPVNYVARDFAGGKKISFLRDSFPTYAAFFKYRFGDR